MMLITLSGLTQAYMPIDTLKYAHFENNKLSFAPDSSLLLSFFEKFHHVIENGEGNIRILHIGGSHVQAGSFPHRIRQNLLHAFPEHIGARGMIFPYSAANKCNNPYDYKVKKNGDFKLIRNVYQRYRTQLGVSGIGIYTADSCSEIKIILTDSTLHFITNQITLFGIADSQCVVPIITVDTIDCQPVYIDTTLRRFTYNVPAFSDSFLLKLPNESRDTFTLTGIFLNNSVPGITYNSIGVNGASVPSFLNCRFFIRDLSMLQPDLVIFGLGINDASVVHFDSLQFVENYHALIDSIRQVNPNCAFIFITNNDSYKKTGKGKYEVNKQGSVVRRQFYQLALWSKGAVWDQFDIMGGLRSMEKWYQHKLAQKDRIHFTKEGYWLLGDLFYNALIESYFKIYAK
jgi:lysophospholipase L1-like esterase